jgi:cytochrome c
MHIVAKSVAGLALAAAVGGCGSEQPDTPAAVASADPVEASAAAAPSAAPTPSAEPSAVPSQVQTPAATPTPEVAAAAPSTPPPAFLTCRACHAVEAGKNGIGPSMASVLGRKAGTAAGFSYSEAMKSSGLTWDAATLDRYLTRPSQVVPGTRMAFAGIPDPVKRKAVVDYLATLR